MTSCRYKLWFLAFLLALTSGRLEAHPAHAKPVNYPYVVGFERFHSSLDDDDYLSRGGLILLNELNCVACHTPPENVKEYLPGVVGTDLDGVASRLSPVNMEIMIRNPRFMKKDTVMPSMFAGPDRDLDEVEALKHYLATLTKEIPHYEVGDIEAGRSFYHRVGCASCHAPEVGYRPPGVPENAEIEMAGLPSVPMNLADLYHIDALTYFLLHPNEHRPSGRMPDFHLSEGEARDLAAYLKAGPDLILPENLTDALGAADGFAVDEDLAKKGKELFSKKSCSACHEVPGSNRSLDRGSAPPLLSLNPDSKTGCFSERPVGGAVPFYGLDVVQKRAISAALKRLEGMHEFDAIDEIDWRMKSLNCYACHERDGVGGAEFAREVYFGFRDKTTEAMGRWGHLPPGLDQVGAKLTDPWLKKVLLGNGGEGSVRDYLVARMPRYRTAMVEPFLKLWAEVDRNSGLEKTGGSLFSNPDESAGHELLGASRKQCVRCHGIGEEKSTEWPGIDLATSPARLKRGYFDRLLLAPQEVAPGIPMPAQFEGDADVQKDLDAIWAYLKQVGVRKK